MVDDAPEGVFSFLMEYLKFEQAAQQQLTAIGISSHCVGGVSCPCLPFFCVSVLLLWSVVSYL